MHSGLGVLFGLLGAVDVFAIGRIIKARQADSRLIIAQLQLAQGLAGRVELGTVTVAQDEQHVTLADLLAASDHDGLDLARCRRLDLVAGLRRHRAGTAHPGRDRVACDVRRCDLGQGPIHDGVGKEGQYQQHRQKDDGGVFDPSSALHRIFHSSFTLLYCTDIEI